MTVRPNLHEAGLPVATHTFSELFRTENHYVFTNLF